MDRTSSPSSVRPLAMRFAFAFFVVLLALPSWAGVVISEFRVRGTAGGNDEFVELYNNSDVAAPIGGWKINGSNSGGTTSTRHTVAAGVVIPARGHYLAVNTAANGYSLSVPSNGTYSVGITDDGGIALLDASNNIIDMVGMSTGSAYKEGTPLANLGTSNQNRSYERKPGGALGSTQDTNNNTADFVLVSPSTPQNLSSDPTPNNDTDPTLVIAAATAAEGDSGTANLNFSITLTSPARGAGVTFTAATRDGSAFAGSDYQSTTVTTTILPGASSYTFSVPVIGDMVVEPDETFHVDIVVASGATNSTATAAGTIVNDDVAVIRISEIQGDEPRSDRVGQVVTTRGIVTARKADGFFLQSRDVEQDQFGETSEGIFVFTQTAPRVSVFGTLRLVEPGDEIRVTARVAEFKRVDDVLPDTVTELTQPTLLFVTEDNPLPAALDGATVFANAQTRTAQLERYEGMLVSIPTLHVVAPTNNFGEFFGVLPNVPRPFREPGIDVADPLPANTPSGITFWDGNLERIMVDSDEQTDANGARRAAIQASTGDTIANVFGPLDYAFDEYRIQLAASGETVTPGPGIVVPVRASLLGEATIAGMNLLNFNSPNPNNPAQVAAFEARLTKASLVIRETARTPVVIGGIEIGDLATLQKLRDRLNADAGTQYEAYLLEGIDNTGTDQDIGFLVDLARAEVVGQPVQFFKGKTWTFGGETDVLHDRPPFMIRVNFRRDSDSTPLPVTIILNHLKSLIEINSMTPFGTTGLVTEGERNREKRRLQAEDLADVINARAGENLVVMGDLNAFQFNDGYVDVVGTLEGNPAPANQVVAASTDRWNHTLTNLASLIADPSQRYSYVFNGSAQIIDHILVSPSLLPRINTFTYGRGNADAANGFAADPSRAERLADHDIPVAFIQLPSRRPSANAGADQVVECAGPPTVVHLDASASSDPDGDALTFAWSENGVSLGDGAQLDVHLSTGTHTITLSVTDATSETVTDTIIVNVVDTTGATITVPADVVVNVPPGATAGVLVTDAQIGTATATDNCGEATVVRTGVPAGNLFPVGITVITWTATDSNGNPSQATSRVIVRGAGATLQAIEAALTALLAAQTNAPEINNLRHARERVQAAIAAGDARSAIGAIEAAVAAVDAAVRSGDITPVVGNALMNDLTGAAWLIAKDAAVNAKKPAEALATIAEGDALAAAGDWKQACSKYKASLAK